MAKLFGDHPHDRNVEPFNIKKLSVNAQRFLRAVLNQTERPTQEAIK